jgi:hypothetical protein
LISPLPLPSVHLSGIKSDCIVVQIPVSHLQRLLLVDFAH